MITRNDYPENIHEGGSLMLVLASQSGSRRAMLEAVGIPFEAVPAHIDERALEVSLDGASPQITAIALAEAKALAVSHTMVDRLVLGSDSLVTVAGRRFDKPASREEAADHLRFFSGKEMLLTSAAALARGNRILWCDSASAQLTVRILSDQFIEAYLAAEWPEVGYCVGVFRIEAMGPQLFEAIEGDQFTVLGMPLLKVLDALRGQGELLA